MVVRRLEPADIPACERVLASISHWFGFEESNRRYIADLATEPSWVAKVDGEIAGFMTLVARTSACTELHILAVQGTKHRRGIGRALLEAAEAYLRESNVPLLQVKTLGPSNPDEGYAQTRRFYEAMGFLPLEETTAFWGADQPALIMVKVL